MQLLRCNSRLNKRAYYKTHHDALVPHTVFTHTHEPSTTISKTQNIAIEAVGTRRT